MSAAAFVSVAVKQVLTELQASRVDLKTRLTLIPFKNRIRVWNRVRVSVRVRVRVSVRVRVNVILTQKRI